MLSKRYLTGSVSQKEYFKACIGNFKHRTKSGNCKELVNSLGMVSNACNLRIWERRVEDQEFKVSFRRHYWEMLKTLRRLGVGTGALGVGVWKSIVMPCSLLLAKNWMLLSCCATSPQSQINRNKQPMDWNYGNCEPNEHFLFLGWLYQLFVLIVDS